MSTPAGKRDDRRGNRDPAVSDEAIEPLVNPTPLITPASLAIGSSGGAIQRSFGAATGGSLASAQPLPLSVRPIPGLTDASSIGLGVRLAGALPKPAVGRLPEPSLDESGVNSPDGSELSEPKDLFARFREFRRAEADTFVLVRPRRRRFAPPPPAPSRMLPGPGLPGRSQDPVEPDPGVPLPPEQRASLEPVIGTTFRDVRIHTGPTAIAAAEALGAEAFTLGKDVFFRQGRFEPSTAGGQALLAHELAHVGQQAGADRDRFAGQRRASTEAEAQAEAVERLVLEGVTAGSSLRVDRYLRRYRTAEGRSVSAEERQRLDALSLRAIEVCEQLLGPVSSGVVDQEIGSLRVDVSLNLEDLTDEQAAVIWGRALADAVRSRVRPARNG